jgi:microcystin-dependent protein
MTGPLTLASNAVQPLEAVPKQQMDALLGGSNSFMPAGAIQYFATAAIPTGWLVADGSEKSRTTYSDLFGVLGTLYGAGNGVTTFNLPDLRGTFLRSLDSGRGIDPGRPLGTMQGGANQYHTHELVDPGHAHDIFDPGHGHQLVDPGHQHNTVGYWTNQPGNQVGTGSVVANSALSTNTQPALTGLTITGSNSNVLVNPIGTGIYALSEGIESRPVNVAMVACIRAYGAIMTGQLGSMAFQDANAVNITGGSGVFTVLKSNKVPTDPTDVVRLHELGGLGAITGILSGDPQALFIDNTTPNIPIIRPVTNQPNGLLKLNAAGIVPPNLINPSGFNYEGTWDASPGTLPPAVGVQDGSFYDIVVAGTLTVYMPTGAPQTILVAIGSRLVWLATSASLPVNHWYYEPPPALSGATASQVTNVPAGGIFAANVQAALNELDTEKLPTTAVTSYRNKIINGAFDVWQRGTNFPNVAALTYTADRWAVFSDGTGNLSVQQTAVSAADQPVLNTDYVAAITKGGVPTSAQNIFQRVEGLRNFVGKTFALSLRAYGTGTLNVRFLYSVNGSAGPFTTISTVGVPITADWTVLRTAQVAVPIVDCTPNSIFQVGFDFQSTTTGTTFLANVQLEESVIATPFERRPRGMELALCQRYYEQSLALTGTAGARGLIAFASTATQGFYFIVPKRVTPTLTAYSRNGTVGVMSSASNGLDTAAASASGLSPQGIHLMNTSGLTPGLLYEMNYAANAEL